MRGKFTLSKVSSVFVMLSLPTMKMLFSTLKAPCSAIIHDKLMGAIASGTRHSLLHKLSLVWYRRVSKDTTPSSEVSTLRTRAMAGKLSFAHSPPMLGKLTNTLAFTNEDDEPETDTHSWSPTDVYPPSSHTEVTGSPVTRLVTSVDALVVSGQAWNEGDTLGVAVGITVGLLVGVTVGQLLVGTKDGADDGKLLGP